MLVFASASFFLLGIALVILGTLQAELARALGLDLAQSGFLGSALALGLGLGVVAAGPLVDRVARRPLFVISSVVGGLSLFAIQHEIGYVRMVGQVALFGIGVGCWETVISAVVVERFGQRATAALSLVHAAATAGAGLGPPMIRALAVDGAWPRSFHALGALQLALAAGALFVPFPRPAAPVHSLHASQPLAANGPLFSVALCALAVIGFAYVGVENGLTLFAVPWASSRGEAEAVGQLSISALWLGLLLGRLSLVAVPRLSGAPLLAASGMLGGVLVVASNLLSLQPLPLVMGLTGIALGPVYPVMMVLAAERFPRRVGSVFGLVAGAGAAGGFAMPWVFGTVGDALGLRVALSVLGLSALAISGASVVLSRHASA